MSILTIEAAYSILSASDLLATVIPQYAIPTPTACQLFHRGLNDTYKVYAKQEIFILRVYRKNWRTLSDIEFELGAIMHLHRAGANVAIPVERKEGGFITPVMAPEGQRYIIVTKFAKGNVLKFETSKHAITFGQAVAEIHNCSSRFTSNFVRQLNLQHLIHKPLGTIKPYLAHRSSDWRFLHKFALSLAEIVSTSTIDHLDYGFCHGDFHGENAHEHNGTIMHFDFDCCGFSWRSYDLATFKWVLRLLVKEEKLWPSFLEGYCSKREFSDLNLSLIEPFVAIRDIWFFGLNTGNSLTQSWLNDDYFDIHLNFLRKASERINAVELNNEI